MGQDNDGNFLTGKAKKKKNKIKNMAIKAIISATMMAFLKVIIFALIISIIVTGISRFLSKLFSVNTPEAIYEQLEVGDLTELIEIAGDSSSGYYLEFKEEKLSELDNVVEYLKKTTGVKSIDGTSEITATELLKKMIKADLVTRLPDLGAKVTSDDEKRFQGAVKIIRTQGGKGKGNTTTVNNDDNNEDSNNEENNSDNTDKKYIVAIMNGYTSDEKSSMDKKQLNKVNTIMTKVRSTLSKYSDIKVVTINNDTDGESLNLAKEKNADILIGIRFDEKENSSENVINIYHSSSASNNIDILGKRIKNKVSSKMNLSKGETITSKNKLNQIIGDSETKNSDGRELTSIIVESGYLNTDESSAIKKSQVSYAQGIVDGIIKYLNETQDAKISNDGYGEVVVESNSTYEELENDSKTLKYISLDQFNSLVEENNKSALDYFTVVIQDSDNKEEDKDEDEDEDKEENNDDNKNKKKKDNKEKKDRKSKSWKILYVKSWSQGDNGEITINKPDESDGLDLTNILQKYSMPLEYLLDYKIAGANEEFVSELADLAIDSQYTIALLDNIVKTTTTVNTTTVTSMEYGDETITQPATGSTTVTTNTETTTAMELVKADSWCVTLEKEIKLSKETNTTSYDNTNPNTSQEISQEDIADLKNLDGKLDENTLNWIKDSKKDNESLSSWSDDTEGEGGKVATVSSYTSVVTTVQTETTSYSTGEATQSNEGESFKEIFKNTRVSVTLMIDRLLMLLEKNDSTSEMVELTKYLIYIATGRNQYKVDYDFSEYDVGSFNNASTGTYGVGDCTATGIAPGVEALRERILSEAEKQGIGDYIEVILALVMQESGGSSSRADYATNYDVFQSSESKGLTVGTLNTEESIKQGIKHFKECLKLANKDLDLTLQSYNFGTGFANFALERGGFSQDAVDAYAKKYSYGKTREEPKASQMGIWAYGDQYYVEHVKRYLKVTVTTKTDITGTSEEKLARLFPKGLPNSSSEMSKYLSTIKIDITTKSGKKTTQGLTVHKDLAQDVKNIFKEIQEGGFKIYEAGAYSWREMNNGGTSRSHHSYGVAIDINVNENYSHRGSTIYAGSFWDPGRSEYSVAKDGIVVKAFAARGWSWGGNWSGNYQDYMHFSFTGH